VLFKGKKAHIMDRRVKDPICNKFVKANVTGEKLRDIVTMMEDAIAKKYNFAYNEKFNFKEGKIYFTITKIYRRDEK
jgi:hypothetical protein